MDSKGQGMLACCSSWVAKLDMTERLNNKLLNKPVPVRCMRQGAQGRCTGMTLRDNGEGGGRGAQDGEHMYTQG